MWKKVWKTSAVVFKGTFDYRIDAKGRLPVPAPFRRALERAGADSVVVTLLDQCLAAYPPAEWSRLEEKLQAMPPFAKSTRALARRLASQAADCALDVQGRILLPPVLRQGLSLDRDVVVVGVLERFEIWAPDTWKSFLSESEQLLDDASLDVAWPVPPAPPSTGKA
jgi:MraZ protein